MRILYIANARLPTEKAHGLQIMKTCEALARAGASVELVVPQRRNTLRDDPFSYYGIKTHFPLTTCWTLDIRFGRLGFLVQEFTFAISAAWYLRGKTEVVYSRDEAILLMLSFFGFRNFIWESHDGRWNFCARYVAKHAHTVVVVSGGLRDAYEEQGVDGSKIHVIPNAIDIEQFEDPEEKLSARQRLGIPPEKKVALYIGRLDGWKGTDTLLEASKFLPSDILVVIIGGEAVQVQELREYYPNVLFLGFRPYSELPDNQTAADVLVVPNTGKDLISVKFTSPLKLIAHMTSGRPIVASDLPSIREIVSNDAALLMSPDDPEALAKGIERVLSDTALAHSLVHAASERAPAYSWNARAQKILALCAQAQ